MNTWTKSIAAAGMLVAATVMNAAPILIDHFDTPGAGQTMSLSGAGSTTMTATTAGSDIIGLNRVVQLNYTSGSDTIDNKVNFSGNSYFSFAGGGNARGNTLMEWDGDTTLGITATGLGGIDLTAGLQNALEVQVLDLDWAAPLVFKVYTDATHVSSYTLNVPQTVSTTSYVIPYADFVGEINTANFASVGAISMRFTDSHEASDLNIHFIQTTFIPEPGTGLLLAGGLIGLSLIRRRRS